MINTKGWPQTLPRNIKLASKQLILPHRQRRRKLFITSKPGADAITKSTYEAWSVVVVVVVRKGPQHFILFVT